MKLIEKNAVFEHFNAFYAKVMSSECHLLGILLNLKK